MHVYIPFLSKSLSSYIEFKFSIHSLSICQESDALRTGTKPSAKEKKLTRVCAEGKL